MSSGIVIVGGGIAGQNLCEALRERDPDVRLTLVCAEPRLPYDRVRLSEILVSGEDPDALALRPAEWFEDHRVRVMLGRRVIGLAAGSNGDRSLALGDGSTLSFDRLALATGSQPLMPPLAGIDLPNVHPFRGPEDCEAIRAAAIRAERAAVIGGGLLGLEAAYSMTHLGVRSYVLDRNPYPLSRQLDRPAGSLLWQLMKDLGIEVVPDTSARRLLAGAGDRLARVELTDGRTLDVGICLAAAGVTPDTGLAAGAGLVVDRGIVVDDRLATSDPDVFAAGDCIEHQGRTYGLWPACVDHARVAAVNLLGGDLRYYGDVPSCKLKVAGVDLLSAGETRARGEGDEEIRFEEAGVRRYRKLVICDGEVRGGMVIGHPDLIEPVSTAITERLSAGPIIEALRAGDWSVLPS